MNREKFWNKKALSIIIGYVLLIVIVISISLVVYAWMKSYVYVDTEKCPEGVSLIIDSYNCNLTKYMISFTFKNTGRFNLNGLFLKIANTENTLPTLSLTDEKGGHFFEQDILKPNEEETVYFDFKKYENIKKVQIIPIRVEDEKMFLCNNMAYEQKIECK